MKRPLALGCVSFLFGLFLSLSLGTAALFVCMLVLLVLLVLLLLLTAGKGKAAYPAVLLLPMLGAILFSALVCALPAERCTAHDGETVTVTFRCTDVLYSADWGGSLTATMTECAGEPCRLPVLVSEDGGCGITRGETVCASALLTADPSGPPGETILLTVTPDRILSRRSGSSFFLRLNEAASDRLSALLPASSAGFLSALLLGNRKQIPYGSSAAFSNLGISHLLAVSGLHLTVLLAVFDLLLLRLPLPKKVRQALSVLAVLFYIFLSGAHLSVIRAGIMQILLRLSDLTDRDYDPPTSLAFAAALICLADPWSLFDAGLQMSVCATLGILLCAALPESFRKLPAPLRAVLSVLLVPTAASVFVYPVTALTIGRISLVSIPATLLLSVPVEASMMLGLSLLLFSRIPFLGEALSVLCAIVTGHTLSLTDRLSALGRFETIPRGWMLLPLFLLPLLLFLLPRLLKKKKRPAALVCSLAFLLCFASLLPGLFPDRAAAYISARSDGKNDSLLFRAEGSVLLADFSDGSVGALNRAVRSLRESERIPSPDALLLTHYHAKYAQSVSRLLDRERIGLLFLPQPQDESEEAIAAALCACADLVGCRVEFFAEAPEWNGFAFRAEREMLKRSTHPVLTLSAERAGARFLYLGASFCDLPDPPVPDADTVLLGAHGPVIRTVIEPPSGGFLCASDTVREKYGLTGGELLPEDGTARILP